MCHMGRRGTAWPLALLCETVRVLSCTSAGQNERLVDLYWDPGSPGLVPYHIPLPYQEIHQELDPTPHSLSVRAWVWVWQCCFAACATAMAETDEAAPPAEHDVHAIAGQVSRHSYAPHTRTYARSTAPIRLTARTRT